MYEDRELFVCQRCGFCCQGETTVSLDKHDVNNILQQLNIEEVDALKGYLRKNKNIVQMQIVNNHCVFYNDGCTIHKSRPTRCAQWPLHPSILIDEANLNTIMESCPGVRRDLSYKEFCKALKTQFQEDKNHLNK